LCDDFGVQLVDAAVDELLVFLADKYMGAYAAVADAESIYVALARAGLIVEQMGIEQDVD
jgi:hypothetical protein